METMARTLNEEAILELIPMVKAIAARITRNRPIEDTEEYADGLIGLIDASQRFDPDMGAKFSSYAARRIRGQIVDGLRARSHSRIRARNNVATPVQFCDFSGMLDLCDRVDEAAAIESRDLVATIRMKISELPTRERLAMQCQIDGRGQLATAKRLGVSEFVLKRIMSRATLLLRQKLQTEGSEDECPAL